MNIDDKIEQQIISFLSIEGQEVATADRIYHHMIVNISQQITFQEVVQRLSFLVKTDHLEIFRDSPKPKRIAYMLPEQKLNELKNVAAYDF